MWKIFLEGKLFFSSLMQQPKMVKYPAFGKLFQVRLAAERKSPGGNIGPDPAPPTWVEVNQKSRGSTSCVSGWICLLLVGVLFCVVPCYVPYICCTCVVPCYQPVSKYYFCFNYASLENLVLLKYKYYCTLIQIEIEIEKLLLLYSRHFVFCVSCYIRE